MEGRVCSDFYRNTSEEFFIRSLMENSVGIPAAPTMEIMGFKNLSNGFRADSEELFKSWLITGENQGHNSTSVVHNRPRQLSRMLVDQANLPSHQNGIPPQNISIENPTPESLSAVNETSFGINENSVRNLAERGLPANNLYLAKAWFNSSQPMTRSRSSELRRKYVAMQNSQTTFGIEAMHNALVNQLKQEFVNPNAFNSSSMCDIITPFNDVMSTSNSLSPTFNTPQIDKVSSVVSMLKNTLQRKKLSPNVEKETIVKSLGYYGAQDEEHGRVFHDLTAADISDHVLVQGFEGAMMDADMEGFVAPTSQSESSAAAPVISTGFDVSDGLSNSGQSPSVCQSPRKQVGYGKSKENGCTAKDIRERMHDIRKEDHKNNERLSRHGCVTSAASGDPTKKRRVERSRKMAEAKERTQTPATSSDMQSILKRCENLEKEVRSLKLNLAFMNRKDSEQTKQIEELQKQNEDMGDEKERLLEEIERILSRQDKKY